MTLLKIFQKSKVVMIITSIAIVIPLHEPATEKVALLTVGDYRVMDYLLSPLSTDTC